MVKLPDEITRIFQEMEQTRLESIKRDARENPVKHKLTTVYAAGKMTYVYFDGGRDKRGTRYRFCASEYTNVAGYHLVWRERWFKKPRKLKRHGRVTMLRDQYVAKNSRGAAERLAQSRAERNKARLRA
jgi:hypothetical protein